MKAPALFVALIMLTQISYAGPSVSGGIPPHPAMTTMKIVDPEAGVDYPTETASSMTSVLALFQKRIPIIGTSPILETARAGKDFPTDSNPPTWTLYQKVLVFSKYGRVPMFLGWQDEQLVWRIPNGQVIKAENIVSIEGAKAGIDFPSDSQQMIDAVLVMQNGSRVVLR